MYKPLCIRRDAAVCFHGRAAVFPFFPALSGGQRKTGRGPGTACFAEGGRAGRTLPPAAFLVVRRYDEIKQFRSELGPVIFPHGLNRLDEGRHVHLVELHVMGLQLLHGLADEGVPVFTLLGLCLAARFDNGLLLFGGQLAESLLADEHQVGNHEMLGP
ncbi:hypothetical protein SDC9_187349 [bioreactor metagenome]|uniref:Uncharacterized protein n=1 Tax=bioreactor metagenome TaxID=1076179 RepID=A0A645HLB3_9ZZZZ